MKGEPFYTAPDGQKYPLKEAQYDMTFKVYKSDRRKAKPSDPRECVLAKGIVRHRDVLDVYVGSRLDAYVVFKATEDEPAHAVHFIIKSSVRKIIDKFDAERKCESQFITLSRPTPGRTLNSRRKLGRRRRAEIKAGAAVKPRGKIKSRRVDRIGVPHRPRAPIARNGDVNVAAELAV